MIGIPINAHIVKAIFFFPSLWVLPKIFLHLLAWYINFSFLHHLLIMRRFRISGIKRYMAEHIKDIALKGTFFSRHSSSTPREHYTYTDLPRDTPSIRLLEYRRISIFPLLENHHLEYDISIFPLSRAPEYTAISYTWGDAARNKTIALQDGTTRSVLTITTSAMECLVALKKIRRYIWIDSICINQSDVDEKMEQVRIMKDIYSTAAEVVAVLGSSGMATVSPKLDIDTSEILRHSFKHHYSIAESLLRQSMLGANDSGNDEAGTAFSFYGRMVTDMDYPLKSRVLRLLCHPYWTRVWIIQEITVARRVLVYFDHSFRELDSCFQLAKAYRNIENSIAGPDVDFSYGKEMYHNFLLKLGRTPNSPERVFGEELLGSYSRGVERLLSIRDFRQRYHDLKERIDIEDVMLLSMNSLATDARDKVFGVIGILSASAGAAVDNAETNTKQQMEPQEGSWIDTNIIPDYRLSINSVFVNASIALATSGARKIILLLGGNGWARRRSNLPSWVIDWTSLPSIYPSGHASIKHTGVYQAHFATLGGSIFRRQFLRSLDRARILGTFNFIDEIKFVSKTIEPHGHSWFCEVWDAICKLVGESYLWSTWSCSREEAVWRTLLAQKRTAKPRPRCYDSECHVEEQLIAKYVDMYDDLPILRSRNKRHTCREDVDSAFQAWSPAHTVCFDQEEAATLSDQFSDVLAHTRAIGCRFAVTKNGYIGTVPPMSRVGDRIFIHPGCPVPVVLRKVADKHGKKMHSSQLVGSCYVLGLMNGEPACGGTANGKLNGRKGSPFTDQKIVLI